MRQTTWRMSCSNMPVRLGENTIRPEFALFLVQLEEKGGKYIKIAKALNNVSGGAQCRRIQMHLLGQGVDTPCKFGVSLTCASSGKCPYKPWKAEVIPFNRDEHLDTMERKAQRIYNQVQALCREFESLDCTFRGEEQHPKAKNCKVCYNLHQDSKEVEPCALTNCPFVKLEG